MKKSRIFPIVLAAGQSDRLPFPAALAQFGKKTALEIALQNCVGLEKPMVVLGHRADFIRRAVPRGARVVLNRRWRSGQLSSLLAALGHVAPDGNFLVYPVDHPLLTQQLIRRLVIAFEKRTEKEKIILPRFRRRAGHPTIFSFEIREELQRARTAREVVYRDQHRIKYVNVRSAAIWEDFDSPQSYARCLIKFRTKTKKRRSPSETLRTMRKNMSA